MRTWPTVVSKTHLNEVRSIKSLTRPGTYLGGSKPFSESMFRHVELMLKGDLALSSQKPILLRNLLERFIIQRAFIKFSCVLTAGTLPVGTGIIFQSVLGVFTL